MDFDNPSYFSMPSDRKRIGDKDGLSSASESSLNRQLTPSALKNTSREKRFFLRSVSSNSADSNQELLILGEPRLCDIAPDLVTTHPASRSNSMKNQIMKSSDIDCDLSYIPLPTNEEQDSSDEVFVGEDSTRYYNSSVIKRNQRRHSIGTFMGGERTNSATFSTHFKEDFPQREKMSVNADIDEHSLRHASYPRKRCSRCTKGNPSKQTNMDDILIVSLKTSDAASLWVDYFSNYFEQISKQANRKPFRIHYAGLEDILEKDEDHINDLINKSSGVKLQIVVICPSFLEFISRYHEECSILGKIILTDRTLALLLGVSDQDLTDVHKNVLTTYFHWQRHSVGQDQDENFTKEFLGQAMTILSRVWKQQSSITAQEKSCFSVTPKKIRQGQNSVFIILTYPLQKEDILKISVEKNGHLFEMKTIKRRNPYIIKFTVPENLTEVTSIVNVLVEKNGSIIGSRPIKCESKLRELGQILRSANNPVDFMCQALGFSPTERENLDNWLVQGFQKNTPPHFNLLNNQDVPFPTMMHLQKHNQEEFPTLLHFACKFGLEKLAMQLLDCPGADIACEMRNVNDLTPLDLAELNGYTELATMLKGYMNMHEFTSMYAKLKEMSIAKTPELEEDDGYLKPKNFQEFYKACPAPRPLISDKPINVSSPTNEWPTQFAGYMTMNTSRAVKTEVFDFNPTSSQFNIQSQLNNETHSSYTKNKKCQNKPDIIEDKVQKELIEIINDFKNNVHSISQVEKLVEEWKNRNDVQLSFKEKQEQLSIMRQKYEQIQTEMKSALKKPTPFERIKKIFVKHKPHISEHGSPISCTSPSISDSPATRPISSLSTSSSGSSGRMSTISGCSIGDSGTHSDNEERKIILGNQTEDELRSKLNKAVMEINYTPVPIPKPLKSFPVKHTFETIQEKPARPDTLPINEEYYIHFPPSGLPVPGMEITTPNKEVHVSNDYMNVSATPNSGPSHEYMNIKLSMLR